MEVTVSRVGGGDCKGGEFARGGEGTTNAPTDSKRNAGSYGLLNQRSVCGGDGERGAEIPKYRPSPLQTFSTKRANDQLPLQVA